MERVNINKALTSKDTSQTPNAPSLAGSKLKINIKPVPLSNNFIKSHATSEFESRRAGNGKLTKNVLKTNSPAKHVMKWVVLEYKVGKTKYIIKSCTKITANRLPMETVEGNVTIVKSLFKRKTFKLKELPKNIIDSIDMNITAFNNEYEEDIRSKALAKINEEKNKHVSFFEGLDV